jgi:hypothetical protein
VSQIAELSDVVGEELAARKYPYRVAYGPERTRRAGPGVVIGVVFERDPQWGAYAAPVASRQGASTPEAYYARQVAGAFTVYAKSPKPGARAREPEAEADLVCDAVVSAMIRACKLAGKPLAVGAARMLGAEDFGESEQWPGVAVRVEFTVSVPLRDIEYRGAGPGTGVVDDVANTFEVERVAADD